MGAREAALHVLIACRQESGWSNAVLKQCISREKLDKRDAALATRLSYGVIQNRLLLDHYLKQLLSGKLRNLHPLIRDILHLGLYQILLMDRVPDSAAVSESVELAKRYCPKQRFAPGLVNGVLRRAARERETLVPPTGWQELYSHPQKLIDLLKSYAGSHTQAMLRANNETPETVAQVNTLRITPQALCEQLQAQGVRARAHAWMENCLVLGATGNLEALPAFREGLFYIQDAAAKLSVLCAELPMHAQVLDCCAAPGGKSFAAALCMRGTGQIISCDVHAHKVELIAAGARRLGLQNVTARLQDATVFVPQWEKKMDAVLCDVPCSGYGIIRKKPDIRYKDPSDMAALPALQRTILQTQASYVRPGGVLLYSTCTLVRAENEAVVEAFLSENPDFTAENLSLPAPLVQRETAMLPIFPGQYDTDGFFIAKLRRKE